MKKIFLILFMFVISIGVNAQWIANGESGLSVRTKLNAFKVLMDSLSSLQLSTIEFDSTEIDSSGIVIDSLARVIYYNDTSNCWYNWNCDSAQIKNGIDGQIITIVSLSTGKLRIKDNCSQLINSGVDYDLSCGKSITLLFAKTRWMEIGRSDSIDNCPQ